jgi:SAM-dependent methyltransferase
LVADILSPPADLGEFDVVCIFDVLEHLPDEQRTLAALAKVLKPGGILIVTVPAHASLWSYFDVAGHHCRRYERGSLLAALRDAGFRTKTLSEFMMALYPIVWLLRRINAREGMTPDEAAAKAASEFKIVPVINSILRLLLRWEPLALKSALRIPIGTSLLAVAEKKAE